MWVLQILYLKLLWQLGGVGTGVRVGDGQGIRYHVCPVCLCTSVP